MRTFQLPLLPSGYFLHDSDNLFVHQTFLAVREQP